MFEVDTVIYDGNNITITINKICKLDIDDSVILTGNNKKYIFIISSIVQSNTSSITINSGYIAYSTNNLTVGSNNHYDNAELIGKTTEQFNTLLQNITRINFLTTFPILTSNDNNNTTTITVFGNGRNGSDIKLYPYGALRNKNETQHLLNLNEHIVCVDHEVNFSNDFLMNTVSYQNGITTLTLTGDNRINYLAYINGKTLTNISIRNHNSVQTKTIMETENKSTVIVVKLQGAQLQYSNLAGELTITKFDTLHTKTHVIYIDSGRIDTYIETGTEVYPWKSLNGALTDKLTELNTTSYIFKLAPGDYIGVNTFDMNTANQSFVIEGAGIDKTFIKGSASWDGAIGNILYFRDFLDITLKNCTIQNGAYGLYCRACRRVEIDTVKFKYCGSAGNINRHNLQSSKAEQAAYWASSDTNDGGSTRLRSCHEVLIHDSQIEYCLRGFRLQDCGIAGMNSIVCNNKIYRVLEGAIYLASGSYDGNLGSNNFTITGNTVQECYNNSLLIIGGKNNVIHSNYVNGGANAGIMSWHSLDVKIHHNTIYNCNLLTHNGIGNDGDAYGAIVVAGKTNIGAGDYMAIIHSNSMLKCNIGRASSIIGVNIQPAEHNGGAYPQASNKIVHADNITDATDKITNVNNIPISSVSTSSTDPQTATNTTSIATNATAIATKQNTLSFGTVDLQGKVVLSENIKSYGDANWAGGGLTHPASLTHDGASTELKLENTSTDGEINFIFSDLNPSQDVDDMRWRFQTDSANNKMDLYSAYFQYNQSGNATENLSMSIAKNGNIAFHGYNVATNINLNAYNVAFKGTVGFHGDVQFLGTSNVKSYFKFFPNNTTAHLSTGPISNAFELPSGHMSYDLIYGDGVEAYTTNVFGVRIRLPHENLVDGMRVHLHSNHNFNHTGPENVLFLTWNSDGGESDLTRSIIENDTYYTVAQGDAVAGELKIESMSFGSGRGTITYTYIQSINTWIYERGSY